MRNPFHMPCLGGPSESTFPRKRSYHRTGAESYYGSAATCKRFITFFLQYFYKVMRKSWPFGITINKLRHS